MCVGWSSMQLSIAYHLCFCRCRKVNQNALDSSWEAFWLQNMNGSCSATVTRIMNLVDYRRDGSLMWTGILPLRDRMVQWSPPRVTTNKRQAKLDGHSIFPTILPSSNIMKEEFSQGRCMPSSFDLVHERLTIPAEKRNILLFFESN